jgi:hypothetical protein
MLEMNGLLQEPNIHTWKVGRYEQNDEAGDVRDKLGYV